MKQLNFFLLACLLFFFWVNFTNAQPQPGDWYREYGWAMPNFEGNEQFLRVGGKFDYRSSSIKFAKGHYKEGAILIDHEVDLKNAIRAEVVIEKVLCYDYTTGLSILINGNQPLEFPESPYIPEPQEAYPYHFFPVVEVPLEYLKKGKANYFSLTVDKEQHWNWPQNLVYGLILRVYYKPAKETDVQVTLKDGNGKPTQNNVLAANQTLGITGTNLSGVKSVDFVGYYKGLNMEGDGNYTQWHYGYYKSKIQNHVGSAENAPFEVSWDTEWIPDQQHGLKLAAMVRFNDDKIYFSEPIEGLGFQRDYIVELCTPYNQPPTWFTRMGEHSEMFKLSRDPKEVLELKLVWRNWSPGYMNGLYVNDILVFIREGERYAYDEHTVMVDDVSILNPGVNHIKTGMTPEYNWQMVHGAEIYWPGIMPQVKYKK